MPKFSEVSDVYDQGRAWQWRVLRASLGTTTGLIVMAMLAKRPRQGIAFGETCDITLEGFVETMFTHPGKVPFWGRVGTIQDVRDNVRRLADHCKLSDADREACFAELRKWVRKDYRAKSEA